jgi:hypothetical protein
MRSQKMQLKVGNQVRVRWGTDWVRGTIVEDRGPIGFGGRTLLRIRILFPDDQEMFVELPVEEIKAA